MHEHGSARQALEAMIRHGDLEGLLHRAEALHGHRCPFLALGVKAGQHAMAYLQQENTGHEEVVAVVECNNCFTDGIQVVTGCTFGNSALIFHDLGKTAATIARRRDGAALRLVVRPDYREQMFARYPAAGPLFEKVMVARQGTHEDEHRFRHIWEAIARRELEVPLAEQLQVQTLTLEAPPLARIFSSVACSLCNEAVMATRVVRRDGQELCRACAGEGFPRLTGQGILCPGEV